jgi:tetratricopeptide (TPR) repeat protein
MSESSVVTLVSKYPLSRLIFLVGAGISQNYPTSLPTVNRFVTEMLHACGAGSSLSDAVIQTMIERSVSPRFEVLIDELRKTHDHLLTVSRIFSSNGFNNIHSFLDQMLEQGASVITTNFDNCIENAADSAAPGYTRLVFSGNDLEAFESKGGILAKVHGSNPLSSGEVPHLLITVHTLAQATGGFRRFPVWRELIRALIEDRLLIVFGYSGSDDLDLTPLLLESQPSAVLWFNYQANAEARVVPADTLPARIKRLGALSRATFAQGDLGIFVQDLQKRYDLSTGRSKSQTGMYTVPDYVRDVYPSAQRREELLNVLLGHFGQFNLIIGRDKFIRSPLIDAQRAQALYAQGEYAKACDLFESFAEPFPPGYARARAQFVYSAALYYRGKSQEALNVAQASLEELVAASDVENEVQLLNHIGWNALYATGERTSGYLLPKCP